MLPILACCAVVFLLALLIFILTRPPTFTVQRAQTIAAPASSIFPHIADFHAWLKWSPWEGIDPRCVRTFGDVPSGVGARYHWAGNAKVGEGQMTITECTEPTHIGIDIEFFRPFTAKNRVSFALAASGAATTVTWTMSGTNTFIGKAMSLVFTCEKMIGGPFEKGLRQLKQVCESV